MSYTEDGRLVRICLVKADKTAGSCWQGLFTDQFIADPLTADQMQQKLTLQRFQLEVSHSVTIDFTAYLLTKF